MNSRAYPIQPRAAEDLLPFDPSAYGNQQTALPAIAKEPKLIRQIEDAVRQIPTTHTLYNQDARRAIVKSGVWRVDQAATCWSCSFI
jgi:hypothetical protein